MFWHVLNESYHKRIRKVRSAVFMLLASEV